MLFLIKKQAGISEGMVTGTATKLSPATAGYLNKSLEFDALKIARVSAQTLETKKENK